MPGNWHKSKWDPQLDWGTPCGKLLLKVAAVISDSVPEATEVIVFGSSPLQMGLSDSVVSGDVDIAADVDITGMLQVAGLTVGLSSPYVEICPVQTFRAAADWRQRAASSRVGRVEFVFPHPIDILVSKISRGEEKDMKAFEIVIATTGHPLESELIDALRKNVDLYRPGFDEEACGDPMTNTRLVWQRLFGKDIDVRREIITPALQARRY